MEEGELARASTDTAVAVERHPAPVGDQGHPLGVERAERQFGNQAMAWMHYVVTLLTQ